MNNPVLIERSKLIDAPALDKLKNSINSYNAGLDELQSFISNNTDKIMPLELEKQAETKKALLIANHLEEAKGLLEHFTNAKKSDLKSLAKKLYPLSSSEPSVTKGSERTAGEMQIQAAINLVKSGSFDKKHISKIIDEILTGMKIGRVDYVSSIYNELDYLDKTVVMNNLNLTRLKKEFEDEFGVTEEKRRFEISCTGYALAKMFLDTVKLGKDYAFLPMKITNNYVFDAKENKSEAAFINFSASPGFWGNEENFGVHTTLL